MLVSFLVSLLAMLVLKSGQLSLIGFTMNYMQNGCEFDFRRVTTKGAAKFPLRDNKERFII
jgi:hypothetical protein